MYFTMKDKFFTSPKEKSYFQNGLLESSVQQIVVENVDVIDIFQAKLIVGNPLNKKLIINLLISQQRNLELEDGFDADFQLKEHEEFISVSGNLRTCFICMRHIGLYPYDSLEKVIKRIEEMILQQELSLGENQELEQYTQNYSKALKAYPLEYSVPYPLRRS